MPDFFSDLLKEYTPRAVSMEHDSSVMTIHLVGDLMTLTCSLAISVVFFRTFVAKGSKVQIYIVFGCVVALGSLSHFFDILAIWHTYYRIDGLVKVLSGVVYFLCLIEIPMLVRRVLADNDRASDIEKELWQTKDELIATRHKLEHIEELFGKLEEQKKLNHNKILPRDYT